ncbi:bacteriohemerythrin [Phaeospirillum tilakii]|uniref:Bacteriohemerythrin n=1 Tax=Phaeospirillum tilakii TaxID=741673 RepID=A0ABW5CCU8_9PROT
MPALRKIEVTPGVWWIEAPAAGLALLCGCPADAVKHLIRRGLVASTEQGGVPFETGPNAILLSDALVQNGHVCNLAEFPVLQMLYRQGMIVPGHPGNTGARPLLLGSAEQVAAQMRYIHRGNYGLISEAELIAAGADPAAAAEQMRLKTRFAFGRIRPPEELLDTRVVGDEPVEIRPGVTLRRLLFNVFQISAGGESTVVDLNLPPSEGYEPPYPLADHLLKREYFAVVHSGEGDGWDIDRPSMAAIVMYQGRIFLVDAGPNILHSLNALGIGLNEVEGLFHTHCHDDHFAGLTALMRADHRLKYFATPLVQAAVARKLSALLGIGEADFTAWFDWQPLAENRWSSIDGLEVRPVPSPHPVETSVFHFRALGPDGYRTYAHLADICRLSVLRGFVTDDPNGPGISAALYERVAAAYLEPADLKKIDVGGGMIHGDAYDFRDDASDKIILAHTAHRTTRAQKAIGSTASFGTVDVLIPSNHDFIWPFACDALESYFPGIPRHQIRVLLNNRVATFNPGTILIKEGGVPPAIYLLLSGCVEMLPAERGPRSLLSAGALLGEMPGLFGAAVGETYRAVSFVRALAIPCSLYQAFVAGNDLFPVMTRLQERREFLGRTVLLGEVASSRRLNRIAQAAERRPVAAGEAVTLPAATVALILSGAIGRWQGDGLIESLGPGAHFGEEAVLPGAALPLAVRALEAGELLLLPAAELADIPSVRWKLFESASRRGPLPGGGEPPPRAEIGVRWSEGYAVGVRRVDGHHRRLVEISNSVLGRLETEPAGAGLDDDLGRLRDYALFHFGEEEQLMVRHQYPQFQAHRAEHRRLIDQIETIRAEIGHARGRERGEMEGFLRDWLVDHSQTEDRAAARFLNSQGVY